MAAEALKRMVLVRWVDSTRSEGWHYRGTKRAVVHVIQSVGWLMEESAELVRVVPHVSLEDEDDPEMLGDMVIPRVAIMEISEIRVVG